MFVAAGIQRRVEPALVERAVIAVLNAEGIAAATMSLAFVDDDEIARLNQEFLQHEGPTDVLSFALHAPEEAPHGDIYIGASQAARQAEELGIDPGEEWLRLAIHGTLHVLGYDHPEGADREDSPMYERQEALLARVLGDLR